jgi:hypothetical protein
MNELLQQVSETALRITETAANPLSTVSRLAVAATMPEVTVVDPNKVEALDADYVRLSIAYNCFDFKEVDEHELQWRKDARLKDYLAGLPADAEWMVFLNGGEIDPKKARNKKLNKLDHIGLVLIPQGSGGTMKKIVMAVAAAAMIAVGAFVPGMQWMLAAGVSMAVGLASSFLLMPKKPKSSGQDDSSYGIDGAKNSATEGIPYPVIYGEFRTAGNFADCYTENVGDDQYLYLRAVLNDGEIEGAYDIELNEQPLANFKLVETRIHKGTLDQGVNDWFTASVVQINKGIKLTTDFSQHTTSGPIDRVRFDLTFPTGLTNMNKKEGTYESRSVDFEVQYRAKGSAGAWAPLPLTSWSSVPAYSEETITLPDGTTTTVSKPNTYTGITALSVAVDAPAAHAQVPINVDLVDTATGQSQTIGQLHATEDDLRGYAFDEAADGSIAGQTDITPMVAGTFEVKGLDPARTYEVRGFNNGGALSSTGTSTQAPTYFSSVNVQVGSSGKFTITDHRTRAIRRSVASPTLARGEYEFQIRRITPIPDPAVHDDWIDEVWLTDVAEIDNTPVAMRGTATLSLKIKLNDQLNGMPQVTSRVRGSLCQTYDIEGNELGKVWTQNPAWHGLDIMCGEERGAGISKSRIDWPRWIEFAQWCDDQGLQFNGVYSSSSNMGDALVQTLRVGHAAPVPFGTKISVAIDRPRSPVHLFHQGNILKDSFQVTYLPVTDRANEYEFSYFDKTDRNKQKTIRYVDPKAVEFSEVPRAARVTFPGVDNYDQARRELWKAIYQNRLLIRGVQFDAWLDSINMTIGENALIQHDMMEWGNSGRLQDGCTTTKLVLDQPVQMTQSSNALVLYDAMLRASSTVAQVVGKKVFINRPGGANLSNLQLASKRLISGSMDFEIASITNGATYHTVTLAETPTGLTAGKPAELWDTDVIEERSVTAVTANADGTSTLTVSPALPAAPAALQSFAFGPVITVRKPYTLTGISGNGLEKRSLSFTEYNEGIFGPPEVEIPIPVTQISDRSVSQVQALMMEYESVVDPVRNTVNVRVYWNAAHITNYGGADVYMGVNGAPMTPLGSAVNVSELHTTMNIGDEVFFKVVAYNTRGDRAPFASAPMIGGTIDPELIGLPAPENFTATQLSFDVAGTIEFNWTPPLDTTGITGYEINYRNEASINWIGLAQVTEGPVQVSNQPLGDYEARIRSVGTNGGFSVWVPITYMVSHPDINAAPVGLQLNGSTPPDLPSAEFQGKDAIFTWTDAVRDEVYFLDYQVTIFDEGMNVLRTEYTVTPNYTYSFDKNTLDGGGTPRRTFTFEVRQRGRQGQISAARTMVASNPAPVFVTPPTVEGALNSIIVKVNLPQDSDLTAIDIYATLTDPCTTTLDHLVYSGLASQITVQPLSKGAQHYLIVVPVDAFGPGTPSAQYVVLPTSIDDYFDADPPEKVTNLTLSSYLQFNDDGSTVPVLRADWAASIADDINQYEVEITQAGGNPVTFAAPSNTYEWSPVIAGETYTVRVRGIDHTGNKGLWSDYVSHTVSTDHIPPSVPTLFDAQASFKHVFLSWMNPPESDLKGIVIWENSTNDPATATPISTVNAIPDTAGSYTRGDATEGTTYFYWISALDTSGNESGKTAGINVTTAGLNFDEILGTITETQIADESITTPMLKTNSVIARVIAAGAVTSNHIVVGELLGDRIKAGTLEGAALSITTSLPATITVGATGVTMGTIQSNAATGAQDPATRINAGTTMIGPGKIQLTGGTALSSILWGGDNTLINGGKIAANTIAANSVVIGVRGIDIAGIEFEHNKPGTNQASWTAGTITYTDNNGANVSKAITAGSTASWTSGTIYIYWTIGGTTLQVTTALDTARGANNVILATYRGGTNLVATYGRTVIDGSSIKTSSITADRMNVASLSAITATIGTFQSAPTGQRTVISDSLIQVFDANRLRVRIGSW